MTAGDVYESPDSMLTRYPGMRGDIGNGAHRRLVSPGPWLRTGLAACRADGGSSSSRALVRRFGQRVATERRTSRTTDDGRHFPVEQPALSTTIPAWAPEVAGRDSRAAPCVAAVNIKGLSKRALPSWALRRGSAAIPATRSARTTRLKKHADTIPSRACVRASWTPRPSAGASDH